jgi:tetratricopeptide (TPR) repeat protein
VQVQVARCQHRLGRTNQARKLLESVLAAHPDHGLALRTLGEIALMAGRLTEAEQWLRQAIRAAPADYQAQYSLVMALRRPGKEAEVKEQTAHMERLKERLDRVEEISNQLLPVRPRDAALHCELGKLYLSLGNKEAALNWLLSAVRLAPDNAAAHAALAEYYQAEGDQTRAAEHRQLAAARR